MMALNRELNLNSITRYVKFSPRFVLEEHGHCEVPAGCGGVVLRWRDPRVSVPVQLQIAILNADAWKARIDGSGPRTARPLLRPGPHVLVLDIVVQEGATPIVLFSAHADHQGNALLLLSQPDGSCRWNPQEPPTEALSSADFDDAQWSPLVPGQLLADQAEEYRVKELLEAGAAPLTTGSRSKRAWLRATFTVPAEVPAGE